MDKPFLTFNEQISKLKEEYNLTIGNLDFAKEALSSLSYYDLINGYQSIYRSTGKYLDGTTIEELVAMHTLNKNIQGVLFKYSTYVENSFKTLLAYVVAENFSEHQDCYLDISNYRRNRDNYRRKKLIELLSKLKHICENCDDTPTKHYRENKNHVPPWILFKNVSFSNTTDLFLNLNRPEKESFIYHQQIINSEALDYQDKVKVIFRSLTLVRKFRNKIAHNLNFLTYRESVLDKKTNDLFINNLVHKAESDQSRNDVWAMVLAIVTLLNNRYLIQNFLAEFNSFMNLANGLGEIYCEITGIPPDYETRIKSFLKNKGLYD